MPVIPNGFLVLVNDIQVYSYDLTKVGSDTFTSSALSNGDFVEIFANTQFVSAYNVDFTLTPTAEPPDQPTNYNCDCDDDFPTATLLQLQRRILVRLGYAAMPTPPPGMAELINDFLYSAQVYLYRKYRCFRLERWFTWQIVPGQRFYDINGNLDVCTKKLDPRRITWVGISKGDNCWQPLFEGIEPTMYSPKTEALPVRYEIRQCIEIWPGTADTDWLLRIKGDFGLLPFAADSDVTTIDAEVVFLFALANAKAHYGQPDAGNIASESSALIGGYVAGTHGTQRRWPGRQPIANAIPPKMV